MAIVRWNPFSEIESLRRQMDTMFDEVTKLEGGTSGANWRPAIELQDREDELLLRAEVPGIEGKDLDIRVSRNAVTLRGEHRFDHKKEEKGHVRSEFYYGKFERTVGLPVAVQNDKVSAEFANGILTLTLPKADEARNRVIKVELGEPTQPALDAEKSAE
ncbi:MAG: Hsp20/alpha crystallin family protein [Cyanobacteriota bacterium]|nr:Hsp20/alpha crystallin family protein [Cyanobacteriota bacterium]